jgi:hypothetical protein
MADEGRRDAELAHLEVRMGNAVELHQTRQVSQVDRKEGGRKVSREARPQVLGGAARTPDVDLHVRIIKRSEEPEPLNVIQVQMRKQDVDAMERARKGESEPADPGSRIEDQDGPVSPDDFDTGGVPAVA